MNKTKIKTNDKLLVQIYNELKEVYILHKIEQDTLFECYDNNIDYGHIFSLLKIFSEKLKISLNKFEKLINN